MLVDSIGMAGATSAGAAPAAQPVGAAALSAMAQETAEPEASVAPSLRPNPTLAYDRETRTLLLQLLDRETGEVKRQWPPEHQIEAYRRQARGTASEQDRQVIAAERDAVGSETRFA